MNEEEFLQKIKGIKVNVPDEQFFLEYNAVVYNILKENQQLKEQLERSEKARKEASNILKDYIPDEYIRSCDTSDGIGRYELDTESWQYKIYEILDIDKGEIINGKY